MSLFNLGMTFPLLLIIIYIIIVSVELNKHPTKNRNEILLKYFVRVVVAPLGIFGFMGHFFMPDEVAKNIGWKIGTHFQQEIAYANLALGVSAIYANSLDTLDAYKIVLVSQIVFLGGAGIVHSQDFKNKLLLNIGPLVYNFLIVIYDIILLTLK